MPIPSPVGLIAAHIDHAECELFRENEQIVAYMPKRENYAAMITLGTNSYVAAEIVMRSIGIEPKWT